MVRRRSCAVSNHELLILRDAAQDARLLRMREFTLADHAYAAIIAAEKRATIRAAVAGER
jgi:hypothetical protein